MYGLWYVKVKTAEACIAKVFEQQVLANWGQIGECLLFVVYF